MSFIYEWYNERSGLFNNGLITHLEPNIHSDTLPFGGFDSPIHKDRTHSGGVVMINMSNI